jgi:hypothetical protein
MHNVIIHINEDAVQRLPKDQGAVNENVTAVKHLRSLTVDGTTTIVADSGPRNPWDRLRVKPPVARTIEWHRHPRAGDVDLHPRHGRFHLA